MKKYKKLLYVLYSLALIVGLFTAGFYVGYSQRPEVEKVTTVINKEPTVNTQADFAPFWKAWNIMNNKSIYANKVSDQDRVWGAVQGLASSFGDPYTVFFPPSENKEFNQNIHGSFGGIGAEIGMKDKILTVISPLKDTPSYKAGLKSGDKIVKINKKDATNMTVDKAIELIRGDIGTIVKLTIFREGERVTRDLDITRAKIEIPTTETEVRSDGVFVIRFFTFSENSDVAFRDALIKFKESGSNKLIVDLRGNPGGYLESAVNIASWFLDEGKTVVTENFGNSKKPQVYRSHGPKMFDDKLKFVILVDGGSASASEILAGALQENGVAKLVGSQTFGKGSVQELIPITDDTSLKVTIAKWFTPDGMSISEHGLTPDVVVPYTIKDFERKVDPQMDKALEIVKQ